MVSSISNVSIWPIDETLSGTTTPGQSVPENNGNERVLHIPHSSKTGASASVKVLSHTPDTHWHVGRGAYSSAEMHLVYSTIKNLICVFVFLSVYVSVFLCVYVSVFLCARMCVYVRVRVCVWVCARVWVCVCVYVNEFVFLCVYVCFVAYQCSWVI